MAEINTDKGGGKKGKPKKMSTRVDLTPMVDLGFLLITFFLLATTMIKPQTMELAMPSKDKVDQKDAPKAKASRSITIVLGKDNKVYYWAAEQDPTAKPKVIETDFSANGIRKYLISRNVDVMNKIRKLEQERLNSNMPDSTYNRKKTDFQREADVKVKQSPIVIIKLMDESNYKNMIDILDEMAICNIGTYAIVDITPEDKDLVKTATK